MSSNSGPNASTSMSRLCPGYQHVENFESSVGGFEYEEEEEVMYVTLDLGDLHPTLLPTCTGYRTAVSIS